MRTSAGRMSKVGGVVGACAIWLVAGCVSSPWERSYVGRTVEPAPIGEPTIRSIPWGRMVETLNAIEQRVSESDVHPDEWPAEKKGEQKALLLKGLQVSEAPGSVQVLGRSDFRTTDVIRPEQAGDARALRAFASKVGADMVVWSRRDLGKTDAIIDRPVTTYRSGTDWFRESDGSRRHEPYSETATTWIPVRIARDEFGFTAFFLRVGDRP